MTDEKKGIFTKEQEAAIAVVLDDALNLKGFKEKIDGPVLRLLITLVDDTLVDKIPDSLKEDLSKLATAIIEKDYKTAEILASNLLNNSVDIPGLDEGFESLLFEGLIKTIVAAVTKWFEKKK